MSSAECEVCGRPGTPLAAVRPEFIEDHDARKTRIRWVPAKSPGNACSPECATFVFVRSSDETQDQRLLTAWRWRQRRAEANNLPFNEAAPLDEAERAAVIRATTRSHNRGATT